MLFHAALAMCLFVAGTPAGKTSADEQAFAELRRMSQELLDAIAPGKVEVWERYGSPRSRRIFTRDTKGKVDGFVDRREGEDIKWKKE